MKLSRIARYCWAVLLCAGDAGCAVFRNGDVPRPSKANWTLENVLKQLDAQAADFHSLTADLERTKVTVVVERQIHRIRENFGAARRQDAHRIDAARPANHPARRRQFLYLQSENPPRRGIQPRQEKIRGGSISPAGFRDVGNIAEAKATRSRCRARRRSTAAKCSCSNCRRRPMK